ncbi:hypothetical protein L1987_36611 [Smallanthus sonchifolius]|uniref:Uncharacterized protein n=1 Tax=Smallanthus sonchifolius TaxID=185202 RepID=A0ACB9HE27_9ASTR|nr:hypothetical protein L1987_36611 [Smallanthus sonchifolius]
MVGGEKPWQEIRMRKAGKTPGPGKRGRRKEDPRETTFYVANLRNGTMAIDLVSCFEAFGRVVDSYVAAKRDKACGLFGFIRFSDVDDKWELERTLANVTLNNARLVVNVAKFDQDGKPCSRDKVNVANSPQRFQVHRAPAMARVNNSYMDALLRNHDTIVPSVPEDAEFDAVQWYDKSVIGKMIDFNQLCSLHQSIAVFRWNPEKPLPVDSSIPPVEESRASPVIIEVEQPVDADVVQLSEDGNHDQFNSLGGKGSLGPNVSEVAQRIKTIVRLSSRKRPRMDVMGSDPFDIDRFINGPSSLTSPAHPRVIGVSSGPSSLPDLNSNIIISQSEGSGEHIPDSCAQLMKDAGLASDSRVSDEIEATIEMGKELGVNLDNFEDLVRKTIEGELVKDVAQ